jgi:hypothetical protein
MVIREASNSVEVAATERVPDHLPSAGDVRLGISVRSGWFPGVGAAWVEAPRLREFIDRLRALEARRSGRAEVESISPGQFWLRIDVTDRAGHLASAGRLARGEQVLEFGFKVCLSWLPQVVAAFEAIAEGCAKPVAAADRPRE